MADADHALDFDPGTERYVIGVDYGTLSGRAVVVRVRDGKEVGSGVFDYPHAVVTDVLPADVAGVADGTAARLPGGLGASGAQRLPGRAPARCPGGDRRRGDRPGRRRRHWHRLHGVHHGAGQGRRDSAERGARLRGPPARVREAVAPPRRAAAGGPHQRPGRRTRRKLAAALRRADLLGMGVRQGPAVARGRPGSLRGHGPLGGGGRLDRLAAVRQLRPQRLHRRLQGHLPGRRLPVARTSSPP